MIDMGGRRFVRAEPDYQELSDAVDRAERAEAAERRERRRRIEAEATAAELAQIVSCEIAARQHAEMVADELQALIDGPRTPQPAVLG
jgi:hypothetical protein